MKRLKLSLGIGCTETDEGHGISHSSFAFGDGAFPVGSEQEEGTGDFTDQQEALVGLAAWPGSGEVVGGPHRAQGILGTERVLGLGY